MALLVRDPNAPGKWEDDLPVTNRYTFGLAGERFFRAIKDEGRILGTHCANCGLTYVPATSFCERCLGELTEWVEVGNRGEIETFTVLYLEADGTELAEPQVVAFVRFGDGGLIHFLGEVDPQSVSIGTPVEAVFKPLEERQGSIQDIRYFKPTG
jgi:uncharacterized OB-fold protein